MRRGATTSRVASCGRFLQYPWLHWHRPAARHARIAEVMREIDADILGLQELHAHGVGPDPTDEIQFLAAVSGFEVVTGTTFVGPRGAYGIALFRASRSSRSGALT